MKIYLVEHDESCDWDYFSAFVIAANSRTEARLLAKSSAAEEGRNVWDTATVSTHGHYTGRRKTPHIILSSFHEG
jgi:hypothetical protein